MINTSPFAALKHRTIAGKTMAYIDEGEGEGDAIVFQHGNPTSSYLWRNVMPHLAGLGRLIACDLIGMGGSDKLSPSGPDRYHFAEQRDYLFALWDELDLGDRVVLVLHDWGSALGFDWANQHRDRVQGIAYMEALATPLQWSDVPPEKQPTFQGLRSPAGEELILEQNAFVEAVLPGSVLRGLSDEEMSHYRRPFLDAGEDRRPTLSWPRDLPIGGEPADVVAVVEAYSSWLAKSDVPKLFVNAEPGAIINDRVRAHVRTWPNQIETTVAGIHYIQEDSPNQIGTAVADFVRRLRTPQEV
jgi:haloalkane dehalogenase